jgi:hypothetical protein
VLLQSIHWQNQTRIQRHRPSTQLCRTKFRDPAVIAFHPSFNPYSYTTSPRSTNTLGMEQIPFNQVTSTQHSPSFTNAAFQPDSTFRAQVQGQVPLPAQSQNTSLNSNPAPAAPAAAASAFANMPTDPSTLGANPSQQSQLQPQIQPQAQTQTQQTETESIEQKGGPTATAPFLRDFSLVAEAAKRAQMAVVMRDMEGISL